MRPSIAGRDEKEQIIECFKLSREMNNPHLLQVGELGEHDGVAYYTTEDFDGGTLRDLMHKYKVENRQFQVREAAQIVMQLLEGLHELHANEQVMRAVRPENVLVKARYTGPRKQNFVAEVKLVGSAFWSLIPTVTLAEDEFTRGEAQYIAPELKSFEPREGPRADVYSSGVIFYEMLVGQAPVGTFQLPSTRRPDLPTHVNDIVELALAQAPEDRYQSARDFITDMQRTFQDAGHEKQEVKPIITSLGWGVGLTTVVLVSVILFNVRPDPEREAEARDSQVRASVIEAHARPTPAEVQAITAQHPQNMIYIPGGPFVHGRLHGEPSDVVATSELLAEVVEVQPFLIDAFEYKNLKNAAPTYNSSWEEANRLCDAAQKRLCTAVEWEKACKGRSNSVYSYGDTFDADFCGRGLDKPYLSGSMPECKSDWGVFDVSGNFREWTSTAAGKKGTRRIVKGGIKGNAEKGTRCAAFRDENSGYKDASLSFRCCRGVDAPPVAAAPDAATD
jgi:serine/threonine protein kinase